MLDKSFSIPPFIETGRTFFCIGGWMFLGIGYFSPGTILNLWALLNSVMTGNP